MFYCETTKYLYSHIANNQLTGAIPGYIGNYVHLKDL